MILIVISLVDIAMVGGVLLIIRVKGYENFVSCLDIGDNELNLFRWEIDSSSFNAKITDSIVTIASTHALKILWPMK